jgi:hypothetical protein
MASYGVKNPFPPTLMISHVRVVLVVTPSFLKTASKKTLSEMPSTKTTLSAKNIRSLFWLFTIEKRCFGSGKSAFLSRTMALLWLVL